ncbi:hypothetical protein GGS23DRAFT_91967 [Durotheca rogersii]|uniref:uncharacterized protein n=1 Tax=Durotheca rogersii TaxID=419775 RepID=UPI00221E9DDA|nr:uncharacterized protein GGS23DRAFT_91967 [Durotheca rogersii]KAI5862304.1 hypothetical protein GGS23DRAFT_91967 [Durotheca rogersii]
MADQCIVCLENLDPRLSSPPSQLLLFSEDDDRLESSSSGLPTFTHTEAAADPDLEAPPQLLSSSSAKSPLRNATDLANHDTPDSKIAVIQICGHVLHDACLREWTGKANSCPICRQAFHLVHVYDKVGGTQLSSYKVEDKKQVAEFDPQAWLNDNPEEEEAAIPCAICNQSDHEDVLLLCDSCDAPYHTYCVGLDSVPRGHWFCLECSEAAAELLGAELQDPDPDVTGFSDGRSDYLPRTQAAMRRVRRRARSDEWQGAWGQIAGQVWDALSLDLDNHDDDDDALRNYRRSQQRRERERREYQRWQQRFNIATRLGAHDVFARGLPNSISHVVAHRQQHPQPPPPPQETPEERQAWGALEKAMEANNTTRTTPNHRKRKSRSVTTSPVEPPQQPERKLKRPRTRRAPTTGEASSSNGASTQTVHTPVSLPSRSTQPGASQAPSFLSSLLKEVEMSTPSDDENVRALFSMPKATADPSSPVSSPSPSVYNSPRALSTTPPPRGINDRPGSPLSLSSHIEPIYPPANYMPTRGNGDHSDSESRSRQSVRPHHNSEARSHSPEIRQPRPRRRQSANISSNLSLAQDVSPTRAALPFEMKESISGIVKDALKPHWRSGHLTADQYASINRDLSHKLYKEVSEVALNDDARQRFEKIATKEVAKAVADLKV